MTTISLSSEQIISTIDLIVKRYEEQQVIRWEEIRTAISPSVMDFKYWRDCFLSDWEKVRAKIQGISLLFSDYDMCEYFERSKDKVTDLWSRCSVELCELQHSVYKASTVLINSQNEAA